MNLSSKERFIKERGVHVEKRVSTGIAGLDKLIEGGFPGGSCILVTGLPGCGKSTFAQQFVYSGLKEKQPAIFVTFDVSPTEVLESMEKFGWKVNGFKEKLKFIDAYSWRIGGSEKEYTISNLSNINELNLMVTDLLKKIDSSEAKRGVFDSFSTLLLYVDPMLVIKMAPVILAKIKNAGYTQLIVLEEGVHDEKIVMTLNYLADGLIEFKIEEDKRFLRVDRMRLTKHSREWVGFEFTDRGIVIK